VSLPDGGVAIEHDAVVDVDGLVDIDLLRIASRDRTGLFSLIAGVLALHGLDVVGASAATGADGVAVDEFRIARVPGTDRDWQRVDRDLRDAIAGSLDIDTRLEQRLREQGRRRRPSAAAAPRLEVLVSNEASASTTVVEVRAPDAPAVLYRLSHALAGAGLDIRSAVVVTLGHEVVDVFYVARSHTGKVADDDFDDLRALLRSALSA
jgi:[protein-PII] uridylyltransferase